MDLGKEYGREVQKMKRICKSASITIPPSVYTRVSKEQDVADRLKALLQKHGLSEQATTDEVAQVRKDVQKQRDLEGETLHPCYDCQVLCPMWSVIVQAALKHFIWMHHPGTLCELSLCRVTRTVFDLRTCQ